MLRRQIASGCMAMLLVSCSKDQPEPTGTEYEVTVPLFVAGGNTDFNLGTHLTGHEEVFSGAAGAPTPADSDAQGHATFRVSDDGTSVSFTLIVSNINNVFMAHIHCGLPGANGPVRMWLHPVVGPSGAPGPTGAGPQDGVLATGTFSPTGVVCPAADVGQATDMPLLDAMRAGLTYVNVHTNDGVGVANTGPGDFPGGEVRGQLD